MPSGLSVSALQAPTPTSQVPTSQAGGCLAQRRFSMADQLTFAAVSGDRNPMHLDALAARRTQAGVPVVHGLHLLMWALDAWAEATPEIGSLARLRVAFDRFVPLDELVEARVAQHDAVGFKIDIFVHGAAASRIVGQFGTQAVAAAAADATGAEWPGEMAADLDFEALAGRQGRVALGPIAACVEAAFPHAVTAWGRMPMATLIATTTLVGMICPGLHSIFGGLTLVIGQTDMPGTLDWRVGAVDPRFRRVRLDVSGPGLSGTLACFGRTPPVTQASIASLASLVDASEFAGSVALVVGGSRGLGELAAKLLAAGGARVLITYAVGHAEAERVVAEVTAWGGDCASLAYDVRRPAGLQLATLDETPTHLYYFATPTISRGKAGLFDARRWSEFAAFYVTGFHDLVQVLQGRGSTVLGVFYPSTTAIAERPREMTEYAMAKAAGELLCADLNRHDPQLHVTVARLPRLPTDLTASVSPVETEDPVAVMLPLVRQVQHAGETE